MISHIEKGMSKKQNNKVSHNLIEIENMILEESGLDQEEISKLVDI